MTGSVWAVVVAAGSGARFGGLKQYASLGGRRVLDWSVDGARSAADGVVLVVPAERAHEPEAGVDVVVAGGATRAESVRAGLAAVPLDAEVVAVHDAARPLASARLWSAAVAAVREGADGAVPGVRVADTLKRAEGGRVLGTVERDGVVAVQTPQVFRADALRAAHAAGADATDDAALVEAAGGNVVVVPGEVTNAKITTDADLVLAESLVAGPRVGHGFDSHARRSDGAGDLVLGGVTFDGEPALAGHSDGDAVCHAITDALLGATGRGDIGQRFPDTAEEWEGAFSLAMLSTIAEEVRAAGWRVVSVDTTVMCERPRIAERRDEMVAALSRAVGAPVAVKGKRPEGFPSLADSGTVCCWAVVSLVPGADPLGGATP